MTADSVPAELLELREQIDRLDQTLVLLLANRFALTGRVGEIKARAGLQACDPEREELKTERIRDFCHQHGLDPELMVSLMEQVMREVVANHERVREEVRGPESKNSD